MKKDESPSLEELVSLSGNLPVVDPPTPPRRPPPPPPSGVAEVVHDIPTPDDDDGPSLEELVNLTTSSGDTKAIPESTSDATLLASPTRRAATTSPPLPPPPSGVLGLPPLPPRADGDPSSGPLPPLAPRPEVDETTNDAAPPPVPPRSDRSGVGPPPRPPRERTGVGPPPRPPARASSSQPPPQPAVPHSQWTQSVAQPGRDNDRFDPLALVAGDTFAADSGGRYRIVKELGRGNMGVVFHAQRVSRSPCDVALKFVLDAENIDSLVQEYGFARMLNGHRYVAESNVLDTVGGELPFGEFQFIKGLDLDALMDLHKFGDIAYSIPQLIVAWAGWQTADALVAAHDIETGKSPRGIIHKDIKPGNVMIDLNGTVKVLDFGLAQSIEFAREEILAGRVSGTPVITPSEMLMRPENFSARLEESYGEVWGDGSHLVDGRADVFALASTMYFMLTRYYPSMPDDNHGYDNPLVAINDKHFTPLNPPHLLVATVSPVLSKIIYLGAHVDPRIRPNATDFHRYLGAFIYPNTIGQGLFASDVRAYIDAVTVNIRSEGTQVNRLKEKFERPPNIIQSSAQNYAFHDELEQRFEKARALDLGGLQKKKTLWRNIAKLPLPLIKRGSDHDLHDAFVPLVHTDDCLRARVEGRNPARVA